MHPPHALGSRSYPIGSRTLMAQPDENGVCNTRLWFQHPLYAVVPYALLSVQSVASVMRVYQRVIELQVDRAREIATLLPAGGRDESALGSGRANPLTPARLADETALYTGTGGVSPEASSAGFTPAFLDQDTGIAYQSRFVGGRRAPIHVLDGLPNDLVLARDGDGRVVAVKESVIAGFLKDGDFYTREQAARQS